MARSGTPSRPAARWRQSGLLDLEFYAALRGRDFADAEEAAADFVEHGMGLRLSPHPFLDFLSLPPQARRAWREGEVGALLDQLGDEDGLVRPLGPLADPTDPTVARAEMLALATRLGRERSQVSEPDARPVDWGAVAERTRRPGRLSVVVVTSEGRRTIRAVENVLRHDAEEVEVVVVDRGAPPHAALGLHASFLERDEVDLVRLPGTVSAARATNIGLARTTGEVLLLLQPHLVVRRDGLSPLLAALADPAVCGVQPLALGPDDTIHSAGLVVSGDGRAPTRLLAGHPKEDARRLSGQRLAAMSGEAMAVRAADVAAVGGLDERATLEEAILDLCARLLARRPAGFRIVPTAQVSTLGPEASESQAVPARSTLPADLGLHERIGFVTEDRRDHPGGAAGAPVVTGIVRATPEQLRWSLKLPSPAGPRGDLWGDTHFADALAAALRDLGQDVVTCRRQAHAAGPTHLDDVAVALRGLHPIPPTPGQVNVLWVISHPDDVDPGELEGYDLVFAASVAWSEEMTARAGREVLPLLQASEFAVPEESSTRRPGERSVVFVGGSDGRRERRLVLAAVEAGVPLAVYGRGWDHLPPGIWRGEHVDNDRLPELYHRHGIVLADHWPDMARHGFIANRVFDAVASGARVICDDVAGVHEVFDPRDVVVAASPEEIATAFEELNHTTREPQLPRSPLSFHDRARVLLERVSAR